MPVDSPLKTQKTFQVYSQSLGLAVEGPGPKSVPLPTHRSCGQPSNKLSQTVQENGARSPHSIL